MSVDGRHLATGHGAPLRAAGGSGAAHRSRRLGVRKQRGTSRVRTAVDLGASYGVASRMIRHYWPHARIIAFEPDPANFEAQRKQLTDELLQSKREVAFEAFHSALSERLKQEGKLKLMPDKLKSFGSLT